MDDNPKNESASASPSDDEIYQKNLCLYSYFSSLEEVMRRIFFRKQA